jgi:hypothetical protein
MKLSYQLHSLPDLLRRKEPSFHFGNETGYSPDSIWKTYAPMGIRTSAVQSVTCHFTHRTIPAYSDDDDDYDDNNNRHENSNTTLVITIICSHIKEAIDF